MKNKKLTKILNTALIGSLLVTASMSIGFAANIDTKEATTSITIENKGDYSECKAFQLMTLITDGEHYSYQINPKYRDILKQLTHSTDDNEIVKYLETSDGRIIADYIYSEIKENNMICDFTTRYSTPNHIFSNIPQGYYLIVETGETDDEYYHTDSPVVLDTLGNENITITLKKGVPTLDKMGGGVGGLNCSNTFTIVGTMPENIDEYNFYKYIIHDSLPDGLTYNEDVSVSIDGNKLEPDEYTISFDHDSTKWDKDCSFEIIFDDIKSCFPVTPESKVVVQYTATINENAIIGNPGNQNKAYLEFTNDPYEEGSTNITPEDVAKVYTFAINVNKVDKENNPLPGAEFKLQMKQGNDEYIDLTSDHVEYKKNETGTIFTFESLGIGEYRLVETTVPTGYNKADDIEFEITVDSDIPEDIIDNGYERPVKLIIKDVDGNVIGQTGLTGDNVIFTIDSAEGTATINIVNTTGIKLPSTGSTGAIVVYCISGVALIIGITAFVVAKKKKENEE